MKKLFKALLSLFALTALFSTVSAEQLERSVNRKKWMIVGSNGIGWALGRELAKRENHEAVMYVRDKKKVEKTFAKEDAQPTIVKGDILDSDTSAFKQHAAGADYIVFAQAFPYKMWAEALESTLNLCAETARENNARVIFFTRPYSYGHVNAPITEATPQPADENEPSFQGKILKQVEQQMANMLDTNVTIICHSFPYGPNVGDGLLHKNFDGIPKNATKGWFKSTQKWDWIGKDNIALQFSYTPDLANFAIAHAEQAATQAQRFNRINFAGISVQNIHEMGKKYAAIAGEPYKSSMMSKSKLSLAAGVNQNAKRAKDVYYAFENEILLDDSARRALFDFQTTPLHQSLLETYEWYTK